MSNLEQKIMANVAMVYTARKMVGRTALKFYTLVLSFVGIAFFVSVPHVAQNFGGVAQGGVGSVMFFVLTAVLSTTILVQIALLLGVVAFASLVGDYLRRSRPVWA